MRPETKDGLLLAGKTVALVLGGILVMAGLVDLIVTGLTWEGALVLLVGLLLTGLPVGFAFRDALRHARRRSRKDS